MKILINGYTVTEQMKLVKDKPFTKELFKQNIITQNEYAQGETLFYIIFENYVSTFWEVISTKLQLIYFSDQNINLLNHFLGDLLYETF